MTSAEGEDGLCALTGFILAASGADLAVVVQGRSSGLAFPVASAPADISAPFRLDTMNLTALDWSHGPREIAGIRLPVVLRIALGAKPSHIYFLDTPTRDTPSSGLILLWNRESHQDGGLRGGDLHRHLPLLRAPVVAMIDAHRASLQRRLEQDRFHDLFESVTSGILIIDGERQCGLVNEAAGRLIGIPAGEHRVSDLAKRMGALRERCVNAAELSAHMQSALPDVDYATTTLWDFGDQQYCVDIHPIRGDGRKGRILLFQDVTAERRVEQDLRILAASDPLTGLPNRRSLVERARASIEAARAGNGELSMLMIDVDHFKAINDRYGHGIGDIVLIEVARRCRMALRAGDFVARMGGEEFAAVLPMADEREAQAVAERIRDAVAHPPIATGKHVIHVTASIGGFSGGGEDHTLDVMLRNADKALYQAKHDGRDRVVFRRST